MHTNHKISNCSIVIARSGECVAVCILARAGHEHILAFNLINMNARIYDPEIASFISPDNEITYPENPQNYNRYSYAMNNPLKYTDPSGNHPLLIAMAIGAAVRGLSYSVEAGSKWTWKGFGTAFALGAIEGALTYTTGLLAPTSGAITRGGYFALASIVSSGIVNGSKYVLEGKSFLQGVIKNNYFPSIVSGFIHGVTEGIKGYNEAVKNGRNVFWGTKPTHGNTIYSFWNSEKPHFKKFLNFENVEWERNGYCVPASAIAHQKYHNIPIERSQTEIFQLDYLATKEGMSPTGIKHALNMSGFSGNPINISIDAIKSNLMDNIPILATVPINDGLVHFVTIYGLEQYSDYYKIFVRDPANWFHSIDDINIFLKLNILSPNR